MIRRTQIGPAMVALLALAAAACAGTSPAPAPVTPAAPAASRHATYDADVRFLTHMIPHHAQALVMTGMVPARTTNGAIRLIADRITVSQRDEIAQMQRWLRTHGESVPAVDTMPPAEAAGHGTAGGHVTHAPDTAHAGMPGMLTAAQLSRLAAARGAEFDRLFLEFMIQHHQGALTMVSELLTAGGAQESGMFALASEIESDQLMEIQRMQRVLGSIR